MSINMSSNFLKLLFHFRRHDLINFADEHRLLFKEAKEKGDHLAVTSHYYSIMSAVIDEYFNGNFHFAAPKEGERTLEEALEGLHNTIGEKLGLEEGMNCLDIGCGIGGVIKDLHHTEANLTGITIAGNEAEMGNSAFRQMGIDDHCKLLEGDAHNMPIDNESQEAAYAIYSLKYFPKLDGVMSEVSRVLKKEGLFCIYDLIKTEKYDEDDETHREIVEGLEYACGMPSLHTKREMIESAEKFGMELVESEDLSSTHGTPYHYCFSHSPLFMWLVQSPVVGTLINMAQTLRILPKGFYEFNKTFLSGTVSKIVEGGKMGILSGSEILVFRKK